MKKIFFILLFSLAAATGFSQTVVDRSSSVLTVADSRLMGKLNLFIPRYTDTTAANILKGIDSCGAVIYTYDYGMWYRECISGAKRWSKVFFGVYTADAPVEINGTTKVISMQAASALRDGYTSVANFNLWTAKWDQAGNNVVGGAFLGSTNAQPLLFRTNNTFVASISGDGNFNYLFSPNNVSVGTGSYNFIFGYQGIMSGTARYNLMGGFQNVIASGVLGAVAIGRNTTANYNYSMAVNSGTIANGQGAFAANNGQVNALMGAAFGQYTETATDASLPTSVDAANRIFVIGNGLGTGVRHNALTVLFGSDIVTGTKPLFGFNKLAPVSTLDVGGTVSFAYVAKTADYTAGDLDYTVHFTSGTSTFTLPTAVGIGGRVYVVKNTSGNPVTLATTSGQTIDGAAPTTVATGAAAQFQSTNANWIKIN